MFRYLYGVDGTDFRLPFYSNDRGDEDETNSSDNTECREEAQKQGILINLFVRSSSDWIKTINKQRKY